MANDVARGTLARDHGRWTRGALVARHRPGGFDGGPLSHLAIRFASRVAPTPAVEEWVRRPAGHTVVVRPRHPRVLQVKTPRGNLYLVLGDAITAVDPNLAGEAELVEEALRGEGLSLDALDFVTCTHLHFDHASGLDDLAGAAGAALVLSETQRPYTDGSQPYPFPGLRFWWPFLDVWGRVGFPAISGRQLRRGGNVGFPWSTMRPRARVARYLPTGEAAPEVGGLETIPCPGHTPEQVGFWHPGSGLLLAGDMYITVRGRVELNRIVLDRQTQAASDRALRARGLRLVAPGHGPLLSV